MLVAGIAATFLCAEQFLMNIEFRRQAHSLTLAGVPLLLGVLVLSPAMFVSRALAGSLLAFGAAAHRRRRRRSTTLRRTRSKPRWMRRCCICCSGPRPSLGAWSGVVTIVVLALVDQLMCGFVLVLIRLHNGPLTRRDIAEVLMPAAVLSVVATIFGFGALLLVRQGGFGLAVVIVLAAVGTFGYLGHAKTRRQHQSLSLVHEFVTLGVGAASIDALADHLLCRIRRLLRAGTAEVTLLDTPGDRAQIPLRRS